MNRLLRIAWAAVAGSVLLAAALALFWPRPPQHSVDYKMSGNPGPRIIAAKAAAIERRERVIDQTIWAREMDAQRHGRIVEDFWDSLNTATNKWEVVKHFELPEIQFGNWRRSEDLPHGIKRWISETPGAVHSASQWRDFLKKFESDGWGVMQVEFRHNAFDPETNGIPARSRFYFSAHLTNSEPARAVIEGDLLMEWALTATNRTPAVAKIDASQLQISFRAGEPAFAPILQESLDAPDLSPWIEPLLVYDVDLDGFPEIVLPALNRLYRRRGDHYEVEKFCSMARLQILNGLLVDFDGDGTVDFLFTNFDGVFLLKGGVGGRFEVAPRLLIGGLQDFSSPRALTCGDIDADGDLDLFIGQYKGPFVDGNMPTPYYDANDGYPFYLLLNDGSGSLKDSTDSAGLAKKRFRRVYAGTFVDLDEDGALDLVVTSDFAGVDVYRNDGRGNFIDMTSQWLDEPHAFGMGHAFGDFNNDGRTDFFVAGMISPTAERLEHLGLERPNSRFDRSMRAKMSFGSRLYLAGDSARFSGGSAGQSVARTGWSWGVGAADFDNDGWLDLYVANGMESKTTVRDYESEFWLHDIFVGNSTYDPAAQLYFTIKGDSTRGPGHSFGGFDKNRLYLNQRGSSFMDIAHLFDVAVEDDCRNLVTADLNDDGRMDLVMTTVSVRADEKQKLLVFENRLSAVGNWIGVRFSEPLKMAQPIGIEVAIRIGSTTTTRQLVTGDSFRSQGPAEICFGLGEARAVEEIKINWPGGVETRLAGPEINRWHRAYPPEH